MSSTDPMPLFVDLDGTLLKTDSLHEELIAILKTQPWMLFLLLAWLLRGRAYFKQRVARLAMCDVSRWPYDQAVLSYVRAQHGLGRPTFLATGADETIARAVVAHLDCFSGYLASDGEKNITGTAKLEAIVHQHPHGDFEYIGNSRSDRPIWQRAKVRAIAGVRRKPTPADTPSHHHGLELHRVFHRETSRLTGLIRAIRLHQWAKNLLVFIPLILAHEYGNPATVGHGLCAFLCLSLVASAAYLFNDLIDLQADRHHPSKSQRPFARGDVGAVTGVLAGIVLFSSGAVIATLELPNSFFMTLVAYGVTSLAYSLFLKRAVIVDVVVLAGLYVIRIFAGAAATTTPVSRWLMVFALFFFISLALVKRASELLAAAAAAARKSSGVGGEESLVSNGRGYVAQDTPVIVGLGIATGVASPIVLGFYLTTHTASQLYDSPTLLLLAIPMLLYWIARMWLITCRGQMHCDPVAFALRDKPSYFVGLLLVVTVLVARHSNLVTWIVS